jgi:catechol 2,3-dioxygenase-like lactoylglutathione lyase family enzyme
VTFLRTTDLAATADFYGGLLELPLVLDQGDCRIFRVARDSYLGFCGHEFPGDRGPPSGVVLTLVAEDVDGWYATLSARGVRFEREPTMNPRFRIYHCFLRDPDGHLIEIQRFLDPAWPGNLPEDAA